MLWCSNGPYCVLLVAFSQIPYCFHIIALVSPNLQDVYVFNEGLRVLITCSSSNLNQVLMSTRWLDFNGQEMADGDTLDLPSISTNQSGEYSCELTSNYGETITATTVIVVLSKYLL